jgi:peptide chain release factor 2
VPKKDYAPCRSIFDLPQKISELSVLNKRIEESNFWDNHDSAQKTMKRIAVLQSIINDWGFLSKNISDHNNAILAIHAGAGGTDSQDWAAMLERMFLRWAERRKFSTEILDRTEGEEAGIKSVTILVSGDLAYGYLRPEKGVHRLVRLSPFDAAHRRHTSFALVEVLPEIEDNSEIDLSPDEIRIEVYKSSGAGGQNVQKNMTAVRIVHITSGIMVTCQNERSQTQNRENALKVLKSRLFEIKAEQQAETLSELRGEYKKAEWGSQIRSYVLHPYQMVKDHRTEFETGNTQSVLDGNIDEFIDAYLRKVK